MRLSELAEPIRELSKDIVPVSWGPEHQEAFKQMKKGFARAPILAYYNPRKQTVLQTDANIKGLGACLLQDEEPVYFGSKALTEAQKVKIKMHTYIAPLEVCGHLICTMLYITSPAELLHPTLV